MFFTKASAAVLGAALFLTPSVIGSPIVARGGNKQPTYDQHGEAHCGSGFYLANNQNGALIPVASNILNGNVLDGNFVCAPINVAAPINIGKRWATEPPTYSQNGEAHCGSGLFLANNQNGALIPVASNILNGNVLDGNFVCAPINIAAPITVLKRGGELVSPTFDQNGEAHCGSGLFLANNQNGALVPVLSNILNGNVLDGNFVCAPINAAVPIHLLG